MAMTEEAVSPLVAELAGAAQPKLADLGLVETDGDDDTGLTTFVAQLVLEQNQTEEQITPVLSDFLNVVADDPRLTFFARWLCDQARAKQKPSGAPASGQAIPSFTGGSNRTGSATAPASRGDDSMGDAMDGVNQDGAIPTGPKSMRTNPRGNGRRVMGHLNRAMDRSNDAGLHRIKGQGRVNAHERGPARGPRAMGGPGRGGMPTGGRGAGPPRRGGFNGPDMGMTAQQMKAFEDMMMQQVQFMMGATGGPAINPAFQMKDTPSLMERVDRGGHRGRGSGGHRGGRGGHQQHTEQSGGDDTRMDMGESKTELGPDTICKYNLKCTKPDCMFAHQSPVAPYNTAVDVNDVCAFGAACQNRKCVGRHPSPAQRKQHAAETECKFFPNCTNRSCPFQHPTMPLCRNGADCTTEGCAFTHLKTACKYNPCTNPKCPYKHEEGQRTRTMADMQWRAGDAKSKFEVDGPMEYVGANKAETNATASSPTQDDVEIAT